jgi:two-component system cell cycle response regulator
MTARVLVVDDMPLNVALLEARLTAAHFRVDTASSGAEALEKIQASCPDIVLLDVMMPEMNGHEVCRRIKLDPKTSHLPVVMVTALDEAKDRTAGLRAGADDFLTKPVDRVTLTARVRSLVRLKMMHDELLLRHQTLKELGFGNDDEIATGPRNALLAVDDTHKAAERFARMLPAHAVTHTADPQQAVGWLMTENTDLVLVNLDAAKFDALAFCHTLQKLPTEKRAPLLVFGSVADRERLVSALEIGVNDFVAEPIDESELRARVRTQLRKKRYADQVRSHVQLGLNALVIDHATGLHNRRFMTMHLANQIQKARDSGSPLILKLVKIDNFTSVSDLHGRDGAAHVLKCLASRIATNIRASDVAARSDIDTFAVVMPNVDAKIALNTAERLRKVMETTPVEIREGEEIQLTVSIGVAALAGPGDDSHSLLQRADLALSEAVRLGSNRVEGIAA